MTNPPSLRLMKGFPFFILSLDVTKMGCPSSQLSMQKRFLWRMSSGCLRSMWHWAGVCVSNICIITVSSLTCATSAASLPHGIHPHLSYMDALHSDQHLAFLKNTAPFSEFRMLDPTRMAVNEVLETFKLIVSGQANNTWVLEFILTCENIPHLATNLDDDDDEIEELPDPKTAQVSPLKRSKSQVSFSE